MTAMADSPHIRRMRRPDRWQKIAEPDSEQRLRFISESFAQLLADLLRSILSDANLTASADEHVLQRYTDLMSSLNANHPLENTGLGFTRGRLAKRCVTQLKALLAPTLDANTSPSMREFVDALNLFPALFDAEPSARSRRARLTWLLTHDRRLDASSREAANALMEACEHLGALLWPDPETA
jgi:hypothetical protein